MTASEIDSSIAVVLTFDQLADRHSWNTEDIEDRCIELAQTLSRILEEEDMEYLASLAQATSQDYWTTETGVWPPETGMQHPCTIQFMSDLAIAAQNYIDAVSSIVDQPFSAAEIFGNAAWQFFLAWRRAYTGWSDCVFG